MAKIRCSNCEKSVRLRLDKGKIRNGSTCKATGRDISGSAFYEVKKCNEFLPRIEYSHQFQTIIDKIHKGLAVGKEIKNIIK